MNNPPDAKRPRLEEEDDRKPAATAAPVSSGPPPPTPFAAAPKRSESILEGKLPTELCLAAPFLAAGDLPTLATVSKSAKKFAISSWKDRLTTKKIDMKKFDEGIEKQEIVVLKDWEDKTLQLCNNIHQIDTSSILQAKNDGTKFLTIKGGHYQLPQQFVDVRQGSLLHCSLANKTIVVIVLVEHDGMSDLWAILYTVDDTPVGNDTAASTTAPTHVQKLVTQHSHFAAIPEDFFDGSDCHFGRAHRSGDGETLVVATKLGADNGCTLTAYKLPPSEGGDNKLEKIKDLLAPWNGDTHESHCQASLSACGQLLSFCYSSYPGADNAEWRIFDLRTNATKDVILDMIVNEVISSFTCPQFTADNEIVIEISVCLDACESVAEMLNDEDFEWETCEEEQRAAAEEGIRRDIEHVFKFESVRELPAFCKRIVCVYHAYIDYGTYIQI